MGQWLLAKLALKIQEKSVGVRLQRENVSNQITQVKRILVPQRENPIVNRLNKTKVEKFPDLQMEREEKLKVMRKKEQTAKLERVSCLDIGQLAGADVFVEKRRGQNCTGAEREEMAERSCL
jgi:hypothetical protein